LKEKSKDQLKSQIKIYELIGKLQTDDLRSEGNPIVKESTGILHGVRWCPQEKDPW
jgi:hypothetical protein